MSLRVSNLRMDWNEPESALPSKARLGLKLPNDVPFNFRILRKSLDLRNRSRITYVYSLEITFLDDAVRLETLTLRQHATQLLVEHRQEEPFSIPSRGCEELLAPPVVVGSGPAGLAAAIFLAEQGYAPLLIERGKPVHERIADMHAFDSGGAHDPDSNYLFGEGGAGTFSDGKLTCRGTGPDVRYILELFASCKGKPSVVYDNRPHLGSNRLPAVVKAMRQRIVKLGGAVRFHTRLEGLDIQGGCVRGLHTSAGTIPADVVVLATGHSARDVYQILLDQGLPLVPKPFQLGVRIEQPQENVNRVCYGKSRLEERLGAADYSVITHGPVQLFSFCMCAGGHVMPSVSEPGYFSTNGMSLSKRDSPYANSGLMVTLNPSTFPGTDPLSGVRLQQKYEKLAFDIGRGGYACPIQRASDFLKRRISDSMPSSSYPRELVLAEMRNLIPVEVIQALEQGLPRLDQRWKGRFLDEATLVGPEARGSSPVRLVRDAETLDMPGARGLYPSGEGAGYAGGIVSAAVDGLKVAKAIIRRFAPLEKRT